MKHYFRAIAVCAALLPLSPSALAAPTVNTATLTAALNQFLAGTPMANLGDTLVQQGVFYNVDPRLMVAIAGAQSSYGAVAAPDCVNPSTSGSNDPFYLLGCNPGGSSYASFAAAIQDLAQNLKRSFTTSVGPSNTVDLINLAANLYCSSALACPLQPVQWAQAVEAIYTSPTLAGGGNPADLSFPGATIDFEQFAGGATFFTSAQPPLPITVGSVTTTISGGAVLDAATNLPVDQSVVYGTAAFVNNSGTCTGCAQSIDINFSAPVSTVSFFLVNGNLVVASFDTTDDSGTSQTITTTVPSNADSGVALVTLAHPGISHVNVFAEPAPSACCTFDFFIDNVTFSP